MISVVKVGGSLFDLPALGERLDRWLAQQPAGHYVLVAGGGPLADQVRAWDHAAPIDAAASHWMCVDLLSVSARFLHARLPHVPLVDDADLLHNRAGERGETIFDPARWLRHVEPGLPSEPLSVGWCTTSDSIAARLAAVLRADELVLLKSALPSERACRDLNDLAADGYVDSTMARVAAGIPAVRLVNFRVDPTLEASVHVPNRGLGAAE